MRDFKRIEHKFDPQNPFTFCQKNTQITTDKEHQLLSLEATKQTMRAKSSSDLIRKKTETIDRLYRNPKKEHRIGQFRSIKNQINEKEIDKEKEAALKNNMAKYKTEGNFFPKLNQNQSNKTQLPLGDIINKPAKLSMKEYLEFKREIFLSRLNKDIKSESTKKLDDFIFYETKSLQQQINDMGVDDAYVKSYFKKLEKQVEDLVQDVRQLQETKDKKHKELHMYKSMTQEQESSTRNNREKVRILDDYRQFIEEVLEKNLESENTKLKEDSCDEDCDLNVFGEDFSATLTRKNPVSPKKGSQGVGTTFGLTQVKEEDQCSPVFDQHEMTNEEKADKLLKNFNSIDGFMDILKKVEEDNLFMIQNTQEIEKDCIEEDHKLHAMKNKFDIQIQHLNETIITLQNDQLSQQKQIKEKTHFQNNNMLNAHKMDDDEDEGLNNEPSSKLEQLNKSLTKDKNPEKEISKQIVSKKINETFFSIAKPNDKLMYGKKLDIDKMLGIENSFDEYIFEFNEFNKNYPKTWAKVNKEWNEFYRDQKSKQNLAIEQKLNEAAKKAQEKNRSKLRKHEGRFDKPRTFLERKKKKVVKVEEDEEQKDHKRYFTYDKLKYFEYEK